MMSRLSSLVPGGCHTYSKGDSPSTLPTIVSYKAGWAYAEDGRPFVDWRMGINNVLIGHCEDVIDEAAMAAMRMGQGCSVTTRTERHAAEAVLAYFDRPDWMIKFCKNGSDANNAAVRLARATTGRQHIAFDGTAPFFSTADWFCCRQQRWAGTLDAERAFAHTFTLNDIDSLERVFARRNLACVVLEIARADRPKPEFFHALQRFCHRDGTLLIVDEVVTAFRYAKRGLAYELGIDADLITIGKGLGNGHSVSALMGKRAYMERGASDVFLLSTTHGAEQHGLAAAAAVVEFYQEHDVIEGIHRAGQSFIDIVTSEAAYVGAPVSVKTDFACRPMIVMPEPLKPTFYDVATAHGVMLSPKGWVCPCYRRTGPGLAQTREAISRACEAIALRRPVVGR